MDIRESAVRDHDAIAALHREAFGTTEGPTVSQLAVELLITESEPPALSLVAEETGDIVGNIIFTPVTIDGREDISVYILAPLAVATDRQAGGIGTALIRRGTELLEDRGVEIVLVLGDPRYYSRSGFSADHGIEEPYALKYPEAWLAKEIRRGALAGMTGVAKCVAPLNNPEYW